MCSHQPAIVDFFQGRKKMTRPSDVDGSSNPMFDGLQQQHSVITASPSVVIFVHL